MSIVAKEIIASAQLTNASALQYTATNVRTIIDKFTLCNTTAGAVTATVYFGTASDGDTILKAKSIAAGDTYTCPEIVGHVLNTGETLYALASANSSITIRASGREIS